MLTEDNKFSSVPISLNDVVITQELLVRPVHAVSVRRESAALYALARAEAEGQASLFSKLAALAVELCRAGTGGISIIEDNGGEQQFRWRAVAGELESFLGGVTPREWSPCGQCLRAGGPTLYSWPARYFTYLDKLRPLVVEVLIIPMYVRGEPVGTIWIVSHQEGIRFDAEDARVMTGLAEFASFGLTGRVAAGAGEERSRDLVWREYMRRVVEGDHQALASLVSESAPLVFSTALRIISFRMDAEEVAAEVNERLWQAAGSYDPHRGTVAGWLVNMTRSRAFDRLRSRAVRDRLELGLRPPDAAVFDAESEVAFAQRREQMLRALSALPSEQRRAIELAYFDELPIPEIAALLGHRVGTVKTRIRMGLMKLRVLLAALS